MLWVRGVSPRTGQLKNFDDVREILLRHANHDAKANPERPSTAVRAVRALDEGNVPEAKALAQAHFAALARSYYEVSRYADFADRAVTAKRFADAAAACSE